METKENTAAGKDAAQQRETDKSAEMPFGFRVLFFISLIYYAIWILICIGFAVGGIDSGWLVPSLSSGRREYGLEAFGEGISMCVIYTLYYFWFIPLYQIIYFLSAVIRKISRRAKKTDAEH